MTGVFLVLSSNSIIELILLEQEKSEHVERNSGHLLQGPTPSINQLFGTIQQIGHT